MKIGVFGTGVVGRTLAGRFVELGHEVALGTGDPERTRARTEAGPYGGESFAAWSEGHPGIALLGWAAAAQFGELLVNATSGVGSIAALEAAGEPALAGKVLLDVANPLDFSAGMPPTLFVKDTDSLAEQIQRAFPSARVVKSLNTMNAALMVDPAQLADPGTVFLAGNDGPAKESVAGLLRELGWTDVLDLGDLSSARGAEMLLPIWLRLMAVLGTPAFNFKIVR